MSTPKCLVPYFPASSQARPDHRDILKCTRERDGKEVDVCYMAPSTEQINYVRLHHIQRLMVNLGVKEDQKNDYRRFFEDGCGVLSKPIHAHHVVTGGRWQIVSHVIKDEDLFKYLEFDGFKPSRNGAVGSKGTTATQTVRPQGQPTTSSVGFTPHYSRLPPQGQPMPANPQQIPPYPPGSQTFNLNWRY